MKTDMLENGEIDFSAGAQPRKTDARMDLRDALYGNPALESDADKMEKAKLLAKQMEGFAILQWREDDAKDDDATKFAKAMTLAETLVGDRAKDDVFLRLWSPDGRDFPNGQAALDHMRNIFAHPEEGYEKRLREVSAMTYDQQVEEAMKDRETLEVLSHAGGSAMKGILDALNMGEFRRQEEPSRPGKAEWIGAANPNAVEVRDPEEEEYRRQVRDAFMSKLTRRARWANIAAIANSGIMKEEPNASEVLKGVLESDDNAVRIEDYAKFEGLSDEAKELVIRARQVMKPDEHADFGNWCRDMAVTGVNTAMNVLTAGERQAAKISGDAAGFDVNELNRRRQYLWAATGRFLAGGDLASGTLPQLQFERRCEDYGLVGDALIGAVSCAAYMTTVAKGPVGVAAMALEGMQQMDDHVAAAGGDITDPKYQLSSAIYGGLYAYTERLQFGGFLKDWTDMEIRRAFLKGMFAYIARNPKEYAKRLAVEGLRESVEEGLQAGMLGINEALALDKDAAREFGEQFVHDFSESLGTMFVVGIGGDIRHHARASGYRFGEKGAANRMINFTDLARYEYDAEKLRDAGVKEVAERAAKRANEYAGEYALYRESGIEAVREKLNLTDGESAALEGLYKEMEALHSVREGASEAELEKVRQDVADKQALLMDALSGRISEEVAKENADAAEGREERAEEWLQRRELSEDREIWAKGNMLVTVTTKDGKPVIETDLGAVELEKSGYTKRQAEILSRYFRYERQMGYSPAAVESMRALYDSATKSQTTFAEAIAATFPGGTVERRDGRTFVKFKAGEDGRTIGIAELVEDRELEDWTPDFGAADPNVATSIEQATGGEVTAERWLEMTPEEREQTWKERGLGPEGRFRLVNPATGSFIASEGLHAIGRLSMNRKALDAGPRAVFHEYLHGFIRFAREAGLISDGDLKALVEMFGEARKGVEELFNEESAADAFRDYLIRRRAGAQVEDTPANRALAKLFSFGMRIAAEGDIRWAEQKAAERAMKAVTDQMEVSAANAKVESGAEAPAGKPAGTEQAKPVAKSPTLRADIDAALVTDKSKGEVVPRTKVIEFSRVPDSLARLGVPKDANIISRADILRKINAEHHLKPKDIAELPDRYSAPVAVFKDGDNFIILTDLQATANDGTTKPVMVYLRAAKENGKFNFIASAYARDKEKESAYVQWSNEGRLLWVDETKAAKCGLEEGTVSQFKPQAHGGSTADSISKPAVEVKRVGFTALTPTGNRKVGGHYEVVPLAELMDSNQPGYPMELQARDRKDNAAEEQTREDHITNFEPGYLLADPGTDGGAPLVVRQEIDGKVRLVVVSGNGRTMILQALAARKLYDRYRGAMKGWAEANGVGVGVGDEANPVLIRVIDDLGGATLKEIADLSNTNAIQQMNEEERARTDAEVIRTFGIAKLYAANADGSPDMTPRANDEFFAAFQRGIGMNDSLYNPDGSLTQAARDRAVRALLAIAVGQGERGRDTVKKLVAQADTLGLNRQKNAAAAMAAAVADLERKPEYAIGADISRAYADYMDFLERKKAGKAATLMEYVAQQDMLDPRSEIAEGVLLLLGGSANARQIAETVKTYCAAAEGEDPSGNLFGAARTREQIWSDAVKVAGGERYSFGAAVDALAEIADGKEYGVLQNAKYGEVRYPLGKTGKGGMGFLHIVEERMRKDGVSLNEAIDTAIRVGVSAQIGDETASKMNTRWLDWHGIRAIIALTDNGNPIITGYEIRADGKPAAYPAADNPRNQPLARKEDSVAALRDANETTAANRRAGAVTPQPHVSSEEVIRALKDKLASTQGSIAKTAANGNGRLKAALEELGENPGNERLARLEARYSFAAANPVTLTSEDVALAISKWGTTDDINKGIYCLPDGTMLQGKWQAYVIGGRKIEAFGHDGWIDLILKNAPKVDTSTLEGVAEAGGQIEAAQRGIAALGAIRIVGDKNGFTVSKEPTAAQYDALYDMAEKAYQVMESNGDDEMLIDVTDENLRTIFTLRCARGTSPRRIIEDLRGWYERGEKPGDRERSLVAMFHGEAERWSIAPKGAQKGAAVEYPDAGAELRAMDDASMDARWSIADLRQMIYNKRPDIQAKDVEAYIGEIRGYESAKKRKLAVHWIITGAIELPEDAYKLDKAIATAERAKVDPFQYRNPEDIFAAFPQHLPKEKPIDPDTVPELTAKEDRGHGVTVYTVSEKIVKGKRRAGQVAMRKVINTHWGKDASPWCLLRGDGNGELTEESRGYWEHYSALSKKVAFLNGRLLAFMATDANGENYIGDETLKQRFPQFIDEYRNHEYWYNGYESFMRKEHPELLRSIERAPEQWWDRKDASHAGIPIEGKIAGDPLGRSRLQELKDGKLDPVGRTWKGDRKNGKYEEWEGEQKKLDAEFKDGRPVGWRRTYRNGELSTVEHYNAKSEHDRPQLEFYPGLGLARVIEYGEGDAALRSIKFETDGTLSRYQEVGSGVLAKKAVVAGLNGSSIAWTDDAGDYYSVDANPDGTVTVAEKIANGEYGKRAVDLSDAAIRAKLEGESAAVLEAVKAEAAAIYREYSAKDGAAQDHSFAKDMEDKSGARWSIGGLYTGSAADYEKPSLVHIGKTNGVAFGWGIYATTDRKDGENFGGNVYEQTFFTNRAPGDESHLIEWDKDISSENEDRILDGLVYMVRHNDNLRKKVEDSIREEEDELGIDRDSEDYIPQEIDGMPDDVLRNYVQRAVNVSYANGREVYRELARTLSGKNVDSFEDRTEAYRKASEFLRDECDIDGIKYPAAMDGSYAEGASHYVSFRDDNIRVDHKWVDGQQRWSIAAIGGQDVALITNLADAAKISPTDPSSIEDYIKSHLEENVEMLAGGTASITEKSAKHYAWSVVRGVDGRQMRRARAKAATVIGDLIRMFTADDSTYENKPGKEGVAWRNRLPFGIPRLDQTGKVIGGTVYDADVIVKDEGHGKFFYDVSHLKKNEALTRQLDNQAEALVRANSTAITPGEAGSASGASMGSIPNSASADNPLAAIANARTSREVEAAARLSFSARLADGDEGAAERALVNYVAYHKLTGGAIPRAATLAKLGLTLGMKSVQAKRIIEDAQRVADRAAGTVIEKAARNGDVGTAFSLMEREKEREEELRKIISGGAKAGGDLVLGGVVAQGTLLGKRIEQTMRTMTAADLADMEGDTGIDLAAEILENDPKAFDEELKALKPKRGEEAEGKGEDDGEDEGGDVGDDGLTDRDKWKRAEAKKEAAKRVQEFIERAKRKAEENKAKAAKRREENRQRVIAGEKPVEPGMGDTIGGEKFGAPEKSVAGFRNKWEFAAFVREWAWDKYQKTHGTTSLGKSEENRLFAEFYRKCAAKMLQDLADKLLDPKGARAWANRRIGELEKGLKPDTIERASADIFAFINKNAIREERGKLIEKFRKEIQQFITGKEFEELKADSTRRLTGWVEEAARYMMKVCQLSSWATNGHASAFEKERNELLSKIEERREVYDGSGKDEAYMEANDAEIVRARWKLALLEQYGGMAQMMPGEIESLRADAIRYLTEEAVALEERWKDTKERQDRLRRAIAGGIVGPNGQRYESKAGWFGHLFDDLNGLLRLRLKHLMRFAGKKERADGEAAINEIVNMLGRGEVTYARAVQRDRRELFAALGRIFQDKEGRPNRRAIREYLKRMEEDIPVELSRQLSNQGFAEHMTYGQMLQLLVSLEQKSYAENVRVCGRGGQAELIRNSAAFTQADALFIDWLRAFYEAKRGEISEVTLRMVGNKVNSPDPLYCPVKIYRGELAKDLHIDAGRWNAIDDVLSRRVMHLRDFDESASILGQFYDRSNRMAGLIAWAESGTVIQNVICSGAVQQQINLAFGSGESAKIRRQLEDTFNGGTSRSKTPGEIVFMDKAMNFITFGYLGFNPLSAAKQTTSFTVWANVLPGGFRELWHHMTHIDREAVRHIMESDEYKVRYGDDTGSGQDFATKALNENAGQNPFMRLMTGPGMWLLKKGDFLPGIWIMQGVYKSLLNKHLSEGMDETAADRLAITEAFNLLEETQQSGRTYNTSALAREHGRLGSALVQFATSPLQQLQYETQAFREWRDLKRYGADPERIAEARAKLVRAAFINHVLLPAAMELVITVFRAIMGDEPKWEKDGYAWDLLRDILLGQASRIFYVGVLASSMIDALFKRQLPRGNQLIPSEGAITVLANVAITAHDVVTLDGEKVQKDLERMAKSLAPTRIPYNLYRRVTGDSDVDRKKAKGK